MCIHIYTYIVRCNYDIQFLSAIFDIYKMTTKYINIYHFFLPHPQTCPKQQKDTHSFVVSFRQEKEISHSSHGLASGPHLLPDVCLQPWTHREDRFRSGPAANIDTGWHPTADENFSKMMPGTISLFRLSTPSLFFGEHLLDWKKACAWPTTYVFYMLFNTWTSHHTIHPCWRQMFIYGCFQK